MTDTSIDKLVERLRRFRDERDWAQFHTAKDLAISVSVEAAELLELFQWKPEPQVLDEVLVKAAKSEVADVFIYLLLLCDKLDIDILQATVEKITLNEARFPVPTSHGVAKPQDVTRST